MIARGVGPARAAESVRAAAAAARAAESVRAAESGRPGPHTRALITLLRGYQRWVSPAFPPTCRFFPSCSAYAVEALQVHGALRGCWLTVRRLLKCAPWHPGGIDPVPPRRGTTRSAQDHEEQAPC